MKVLGVLFDYTGKDAYTRLERTWRKSIEVNCPGSEIRVEAVDPPREVKKNFGLSSNWHKFKLWVSFIEAQPEGELVTLMDIDTLVLGDLREAFRESFDIGITRRTGTDWPYNGGVIFVRCTSAAKAFIRQWGEIDERMYADQQFHDPYKIKYKGQNQASLGWMVEHNEQAEIQEFPCAVWNACNEDWRNFDDTVTVLHLKSNLRRYCLGELRKIPSALTEACAAYRKYDALVREGEGA